MIAYVKLNRIFTLDIKKEAGVENETKLSLQQIIEKACAFRPEDRFQDAGEVMAALNKLDKYDVKENNHQKGPYDRKNGQYAE